MRDIVQMISDFLEGYFNPIIFLRFPVLVDHRGKIRKSYAYMITYLIREDYYQLASSEGSVVEQLRHFEVVFGVVFTSFSMRVIPMSESTAVCIDVYSCDKTNINLHMNFSCGDHVLFLLPNSQLLGRKMAIHEKGYPIWSMEKTDILLSPLLEKLGQHNGDINSHDRYRPCLNLKCTKIFESKDPGYCEECQKIINIFRRERWPNSCISC